MLEISPEKVAHVIIRAREYDAKTGSWEDSLTSGFREDDGNSILENFSGDSTSSELTEFIAALNEDEQASLVAVAWVGRGSFSPEELDEAIQTAKNERVNKTENYLIGIPLLADYLEEGLDKLGFSVEDAEDGIL
jgi:Protein of unknown function (DUF3775)